MSDKGWLVLTLRLDEAVKIGDDIEVVLLEIPTRGRCKVAVVAPKSLGISHGGISTRDTERIKAAMEARRAS